MEFIIRMQKWFSRHKSVSIIHHIKRKLKSHMIISTDAEKTFDKIQHPIMTTSLSKQGIEGNFLNLLKDSQQKSTANNIHRRETFDMILSKTRSRQEGT